MLFSGKISFQVAVRLTPRFLVSHVLRFATIRHYSRLFAIIRTIRDYLYYSLSDMFRSLNKVKPCAAALVLGWVTKYEYPVL